MKHDTTWMQEALIEAGRALEEGELPIGAVIVAGNDTLVSRSRAADFTTGNRSSHAEIKAIVGTDLNVVRERGLTVYTTLEPCVMCAAAILIEGITRVVYSLIAPRDGGLFLFNDPLVRSRCFNAQKPSISSGVLRREAVKLFSRYVELYPEREGLAEFARLVVGANR